MGLDKRAGNGLPELTDAEREIVDRFHDLYYRRWRNGGRTIDLSWFGVELLKCPLDLWMFQEIIARVRPELIIESGTYLGGSALYLANLCDLMGVGTVVTIDKETRAGLPRHDRIRYMTGSSTTPEIHARIQEYVKGAESVLVILDSDHEVDHVFDELQLYGDYVTRGSYLIVEDTNINGHPTYPEFGPGPAEAVARFLEIRSDFVVDRECERFLLTFNPQGYLRKL